MSESISTARSDAASAAVRTNPLGVDAPLAERTASAMAGARAPRRWGWWYAFEWVFRSMRAYGATIIVGGVGFPFVYMLGLGMGLAAVIPVSVAEGANGPVSYVAFVAPALLVTSAVMVTSEEYTFPVMGGFKWHKTYFGVNATPIRPAQLAIGVMGGGVARMIFVSVIFYLVMLNFGVTEQPWLGWATIPVALLAALGFGLPLMAFSANQKEDKGQFALVQRFVFTPLFLFSGTFYPLDTLPTALQWVGWISPIWHGSEVSRVLTYGAEMSAGLLIAHLAIPAVMAAVGGALTVRAFRRRLR